MPEPSVDITYVRTHPDVTFEKLANFYNFDLLPGGSNPDQRKTLCMSHDDHNPSLGINVGKRVFYCRACHVKGNILDFVMLLENLDPRPAAIRLAEICGTDTAASYAAGHVQPKRSVMPIERLRARQAKPGAADTGDQQKQPSQTAGECPRAYIPAPSAQKQGHGIQRSAETQETASPVFTPYTRKLPLLTEHPYLEKRGITSDAAGFFELGYCERGYQRNRIAFRLHDADGNPLGYGGRWADDAVPSDKGKFLLPKAFPKQSHLYNLHRLPERTDIIAIVESMWSVVRLWQLEYPAVATLGSALSERHLKLLDARGIKYVHLLFDGDEAGRLGVAAALPNLAKQCFVRAPDVPDGFKPHNADDGLLQQLLA